MSSLVLSMSSLVSNLHLNVSLNVQWGKCVVVIDVQVESMELEIKNSHKIAENVSNNLGDKDV